jgi:hypothetical protein
LRKIGRFLQYGTTLSYSSKTVGVRNLFSLNNINLRRWSAINFFDLRSKNILNVSLVLGG